MESNKILLNSADETVPIHIRPERLLGSNNIDLSDQHRVGALQTTESSETVYSSNCTADYDQTLDPTEEDNLLRPDSFIFKLEDECCTEDVRTATISGVSRFSEIVYPSESAEDDFPRDTQLVTKDQDIGSLEKGSDERECSTYADSLVDDVVGPGYDFGNSLPTPILSQEVHQDSDATSYEPKLLSIPPVVGAHRELGIEVDEPGISIINRMITQCDQIFSVLSTSSTNLQDNSSDHILGDDYGVPDNGRAQDINFMVGSEWETKSTGQQSFIDHAVCPEFETNEEMPPELDESTVNDYEKMNAFSPELTEPTSVEKFCAEIEPSQDKWDLIDAPSDSIENVAKSFEPTDDYLDIISDEEFVKKVLIESILLNMNLENLKKEFAVPHVLHVGDHLEEKCEIDAECASKAFESESAQIEDLDPEHLASDPESKIEERQDLEIIPPEDIDFPPVPNDAIPGSLSSFLGHCSTTENSINDIPLQSGSSSSMKILTDDLAASYSKYTSVSKFSQECATNYSMRSDSLINFLHDPYDDQLEKDRLGCGPTSSDIADPSLDGTAKAQTDDSPDDYFEGETLIESQSSEETKDSKVVAIDNQSSSKINQSILERDPSEDELLSRDAISVTKSEEDTSKIVLELSESFKNLTIHSPSECSFEASRDESGPNVTAMPTDFVSEILGLPENNENMTTQSLFSDQDSPLNKPFIRSTSICNNFKCFPENSSTPIAKAINEGFIAENPSLLELSFLANSAPDQETMPANSSIAASCQQLGSVSNSCKSGYIRYERVTNDDEGECFLTIPPEIRSYATDAIQVNNSGLEGEFASRLQTAGIPNDQSDPCPDVLRSIASVVDHEFDGIFSGYKPEFDASEDLASLSPAETGHQYDRNDSWKTPGSNSFPYKANSVSNAYNDSTYYSGTHDYFGNMIWPPSPVQLYENSNFNSSEREHLEECERTAHDNNLLGSLDLDLFGNDDTDHGPAMVLNNNNGEECVHQCAGPTAQMNWPAQNDANPESLPRAGEFFDQQGDGGFPKFGTTYFLQNSVASSYETTPPILGPTDFQAIGMVREAEGLRRGFSLSDDVDQQNHWAAPAPITRIAIPVPIATSNFPNNFVLADQQEIDFPGSNGNGQNYFGILDPFGTTVFSTPNHPPLLYNSLFSLPIPLPPVVLPIPPVHMNQNVAPFDDGAEDRNRFQVSNWRQASDNDQCRVSLPVVDMDSVDFQHPGLFDDVEEEFSFFPRSTLARNDSLQTLRSKCDSLNGSLLGESLRSVLSTLNKDEAARHSMPIERRKYSEPSLISNLKSLSRESLPTVVADDGFSGGGDDNYSAKVRFLNELNLALNESLVDDELNNLDTLRSRFGEVLGETMLETRHENVVPNVAIGVDCRISGSDSKDFCLNGKEVALKAKSSFTKSDYELSYNVVESILEGILDEIQSVGVSNSQFYFSLGEEILTGGGRGSFDHENIVHPTNSDELIQQQMMVLVEHDFEDYPSWKGMNETLGQRGGKPPLDILNDPSHFSDSAEKKLEDIVGRIVGEEIESVEKLHDKVSDVAKPPEGPNSPMKKGRRRRKKTSAIKLFAEENVILEEAEKNVEFPVSPCPIGILSKASSKLEASSSDMGFNEIVPPESPDVTNNDSEIPDGALDSSKSKKRNRRRKKKTV
ncbi:Hypothetical protein NTJ_06341 [Nesidiocoris tenuis]|uniref:Uncharacterized protein n=1 Tax=Nesidiocoris tenuis TaxID=355587 RepID=A0ABN7AT16_9HEMI|nr:Hypothetical protein NTJ_06341 [Nesidiocoris tenuis]